MAERGGALARHPHHGEHRPVNVIGDGKWAGGQLARPGGAESDALGLDGWGAM